MKRNNVDKDKNVCNKLIKIFKEPFGECNSAENTNTSVDFCQQVCTTSRNHWSQTKKKPQRWRVTWVETRHLSGLRQGVCGTDSSKPRTHPSPVCLLQHSSPLPPLKPRIILISATGQSNSSQTRGWDQGWGKTVLPE